MRFSKILIVALTVFSLALPSYEAAARVGSRSSSMSSSRTASPAPQRVGGGSDAGMQRGDVMNRVRSQDAAPQPVVPAPAAPAPTAANQPSAQPAGRQFGVGSMVGAAAAGAAVGYLANSAMHNNGYAQPGAGYPATADQHAGITGSSPWGFILLLLAGTAAIMGVLMMLSRRREATVQAAPAYSARNSAAPLTASAPSSEQQEFERNALEFFNALQEANNRGDIAHLEEHVAEPLRSQLAADIQNRATSSRTQVMMMKAERVDLTEESGRSIASVRFRGMVSEDENTTPEKIDEVWHFVRAAGEDTRWQLAGIEQV